MHTIFSMLKKMDFQPTCSTRILCNYITFRFFAQTSMIVGENFGQVHLWIPVTIYIIIAKYKLCPNRNIDLKM